MSPRTRSAAKRKEEDHDSDSSVSDTPSLHCDNNTGLDWEASFFQKNSVHDHLLLRPPKNTRYIYVDRNGKECFDNRYEQGGGKSDFVGNDHPKVSEATIDGTSYRARLRNYYRVLPPHINMPIAGISKHARRADAHLAEKIAKQRKLQARRNRTPTMATSTERPGAFRGPGVSDDLGFLRNPQPSRGLAHGCVKGADQAVAAEAPIWSLRIAVQTV